MIIIIIIIYDENSNSNESVTDDLYFRCDVSELDTQDALQVSY